MQVDRVLAWPALAAWGATIALGNFLDFRDEDPDWLLGIATSISFMAAAGLSFMYWSFWAIAREGRFAKSLLTVLIAVTVGAIFYAVRALSN
jgi:hypothetical protein